MKRVKFGEPERIFNGKIYKQEWDWWYRDKSSAEYRAKAWRKNFGWSIRIVPQVKFGGNGKKIHGYALYARKNV